MEYFNPEPFSLKKALTASFSAHLIIIILILTGPKLPFSSEPIPTPIYRVNLVSFPAAPPGPPPPAARKSPGSTPSGPRVLGKPGKPDKPAPRRTKKPKSSRPRPPKPKDRSQELAQAISSIKRELIQKIESQSQPEPVVLGPLGPGFGPGSGPTDFEFQRYLERISYKIKSSWSYPASQPAKQVVIVIKIRKDGEILEAQIERSSGDKAYDASALRAIQKANPLPPLPSLRYGHPLEIGLRF